MAVSHPRIRLVHISRGAATTAGVLSLGGLVLATAEDWPLWARGLAAILPWVPIFVRRLAAVHQEYEWLALFYALAVTQTAHFVEHIAQMIQIHILQLSGADARGIFGALDIEWVHFIWNMWVLLAAQVLLMQFRSNRWLWLTALLSGWHAIEHAYIFSVYMQTGVAGTPGLLSQGGAIAGGLPVSRPDLHFVYNLVETVPLLLGFFRSVSREGLLAASRSLAELPPAPPGFERSD